MAKKTAMDKLESAISGILDEYANDVQGNIDAITKAMGQKGATALRNKSRETFPGASGKYARGWKYEFRQTRRYSKTTIFNEQYGLPHLLENGHVIRNGTKRTFGRVPGHEHIKPVADELTEAFEKEVLDKL